MASHAHSPKTLGRIRLAELTEKQLLGGFDGSQLIAGINHLLWGSYACEAYDSPDRKNLCDLPEKLRARLDMIKRLAAWEEGVKPLLRSEQSSATLLSTRSKQTGLLAWLSELNRLMFKAQENAYAPMQCSPLVETLYQFNQDIGLSQIRVPEDLPLATDFNIQKLDALRQNLPSAKRMNLKATEKSAYEKNRDKRMRNCNKRRRTLYENLRQFRKKGREMLAIHIVFETYRPFNAFSINSQFDYPKAPSVKPTHFVNAFLGLRDQCPYNKTLFRGFLGYVRKLELEDPYHASGGFVTLLFDQDHVEKSPYELGQALVQLLGKLSPDDETGHLNLVRYAFHSQRLFTSTADASDAPSNAFKELLGAVNFYTHADYFFKAPDPQKSRAPCSLPKLMAYSKGGMKPL